jgi:hypothetical protein
LEDGQAREVAVGKVAALPVWEVGDLFPIELDASFAEVVVVFELDRDIPGEVEVGSVFGSGLVVPLVDEEVVSDIEATAIVDDEVEAIVAFGEVDGAGPDS